MNKLDLAVIWQHLEPYAWMVGGIIAGILIGLLVHLILWQAVRRFAKRTKTILDDILNRRWRKPTQYVLATLTSYIVLQTLSSHLPESISGLVNSLLQIILVISIVFALVRLTHVAEEVILHHYNVNVKDNLRARQIHTQVRILRRISTVIIVIIGVGALALSYEQFRELGTGILASAGIAGIVLGLAAQKTLGNLLAGIQIAITQPIRLDDVVIVENEWGRIEEITLTYVVVRIWDLRRLILPISYFIEKPFQNWTRVSADILGTVYLYVDYTIPVDEIRKELTRLLENSKHWDKKVNSVQVTNTTDKTVEVRALMSAADASLAWDLRCEVREGLISFIKVNYPDVLPKARVMLDKQVTKTDQ